MPARHLKQAVRTLSRSAICDVFSSRTMLTCLLRPLLSFPACSSPWSLSSSLDARRRWQSNSLYSLNSFSSSTYVCQGSYHFISFESIIDKFKRIFARTLGTYLLCSYSSLDVSYQAPFKLHMFIHLRYTPIRIYSTHVYNLANVLNEHLIII
jgi:hypothetical protein